MNIILQIILELLIAAVLALVLRRWVFLLVFVKGHSMKDSLLSGDLLFATRRRRRNAVKRFDVVLCRYPNRRELFVKRVIALPGEVFSMSDDTVYINGKAIEEPFSKRHCLREVKEIQLADHEYFVMGDNRPISRDSRNRAVGPIADENIVAIVRCIVLPPRRIGKI